MRLTRIIPTTNLSKLNEVFYKINKIANELIGRSLDLTLEEKIIWIKILAYTYKSEYLSRYLGINYNKGLFINGPIGCGKTTLFRILEKLIPSEQKFLIKSCKETVLEFSINGFYVIHQYTSISLLGRHDIMFDDLGAEGNIKHFGNDCNVFQEMISLRHERFIYNQVKTHFTSNMKAFQIEGLYSKRIRSRLKEMVNIISYPTNYSDKRK